MKKIYLIDPGHGGIIDGVYQTAPKKMFVHGPGNIAYEGVLNRQIVNTLMTEMESRGIPYINIVKSELDINLKDRVDIANKFAQRYGNENVLGISFHSNAGGGKGFEIYTSPGETKSDKYATIFYDIFQKNFPNWKMRKDLSDNDPDKESAFYILKNTNCPWILPEWGFFDNINDWELIKSTYIQFEYVKMILEFMETVENEKL